VANRYDAHGTTLTAAGLIFGILIAVISFWTLWQTKRIEHLQGANIDGFRMLTVSITESIEKLTDNFEKHGKKASSHHRIFFLTTNPHFGGLSFPLTSEQEDFERAFLKAADFASADPKFDVSVLCGSPTTIKTFNENWLTKNGMQDRLEDTTAIVERFIRELNEHAKREVVIRKNDISDMQFAIVGNTVFEFILYIPEHGGPTGIAGARKIEDGLVCRRFSHHFKVLRNGKA